MKIRVILFIAAPMLFLSCKGKSQNPGEIGARVHAKEQASEFKVPVQVTTARRGAIQEKITIYGKLAPKQETLLSSQFPGRILDLSLSEGDRVAKGQVVAVIQSPKAEALQMAASNNPAQTQTRVEELLPISIRAPFSGIVTNKFHFSGDVVAASEPILKIQQDAVFYLWGQLPAVYLPDIRIGQKLNIAFPDLPQVFVHGKIDAINSTVDRKTQTVQIRTLLLNPKHLLKSGLFAKIEIILKSLEQATLVPRNAVLSGEAASFVFLKQKGIARLQPVRIGLKSNNMFAVQSGLTPGDSVIVLGNYELKDGMAVEVMH